MAKLEDLTYDAAEKQLGNEPQDVSGEKRGCDIASKLVADTITATITRYEIVRAQNKPDDVILASGQVEAGQQKLVCIRKPFRQEPDFAVESVNCRLRKLLARGERPV